MKKILLLFSCFVLLAIGTLNSNAFFDLCARFSNAKLSLYCENAQDAGKIFGKIKELEILETKAGVIISVPAKDCREVVGGLENINGFSLKIENDFENVQNLIDNIKILKRETNGGNEIYYGFMANLVNFCFIDGKKINLQIAINHAQNLTIIGSPLILGSY